MKTHNGIKAGLNQPKPTTGQESAIPGWNVDGTKRKPTPRANGWRQTGTLISPAGNKYECALAGTAAYEINAALVAHVESAVAVLKQQYREQLAAERRKQHHAANAIAKLDEQLAAEREQLRLANINACETRSARAQ